MYAKIFLQQILFDVAVLLSANSVCEKAVKFTWLFVTEYRSLKCLVLLPLIVSDGNEQSLV